MKATFLFVMMGIISVFGQNAAAQSEKDIVAKAFEAWATKGTSDVFDLLDDHLQWNINGSTPWSKMYKGKQQFMEEVIIPLNKKLSVKIKPTVKSIFQDGPTVIVIWDGEATALDGRPYRSSYAWIMTFEGEKIVRVNAFLDGMEFGDIMQRIPVE